MSYKIISGIYTITNKLNGKIYVGYAKNLTQRINKHKLYLKKNWHQNPHLQNAYKKYKEESFEFEILEECEEQFLTSQEHYWATLLNVHDRRFGYNILPTHPHAKNASMSEETKKKLSIINKKKGINPKMKEAARLANIGRKMSDYNKQVLLEANKKRGYSQLQTKESIEKAHRNRIRSVIQYDLEGNFIKEWNRIVDAAEGCNIPKNGIMACCKGRLKRVYNYIFKYKTDNYPIKIDPYQKRKY